MAKLITPLTFLLCMALSTGLSAQSFFDLIFDPEVGAVTEITLSLPVDSIDGRSEAEQPGHLAFTDREGNARYFSADVSARGRFRRQRCTTPPLRLDLSKGELEAAGLADYDKYKLVIPCYEDSAATDLLLKEYLAYKAYALLSSEAHLRAQLLRLTIKDATVSYADQSVYAFLIEETDEMAHRLGGKELDEAIGLPATRFDARTEATHALFQFLIGNGDWSLPMQRNVKVVERATDGKLLPVGYDFDFSGWVGAGYASPNPSIGQQNVYQRVYLGYAQSEDVLAEVAEEFRGERRKLYRLIEEFDLIDEVERRILTRFVRRFYQQLAAAKADPTGSLYFGLRGKEATVLPPGASPASYGGQPAEPGK